MKPDANDADSLITGALWACGIIAFIIDIWLLDRTKTIGARLKEVEKRIQHFEKWVESLPVQKLMTWHLGYISDVMESVIWKKHPYWICFITGYLVTAVCSAYNIMAFSAKIKATHIPFVTADMIPSSILLDPIPASILGGLIFVFGRRLLLSGRSRNIIFLYVSVLFCKGLAFQILVILCIWGGMEGLITYAHLTVHPNIPNLAGQYFIQGMLSSIMFYLFCYTNAVGLLNGILYLLEISVILWLTVYFALFLTRFLRWAIRTTESMYFTGAVGALAAVYEAISKYHEYVQPETWPPNARLWVLFFFGIGH